ncbi:MAG: glycoside hydrolase family 2 protein, partial [Bacteroidales bacterium]
MKLKITIYFFSFILLCSCTDKEAGIYRRDEILLSGNDWQLVSYDPGEGTAARVMDEGFPSERAIEAKVPGDIHWDLERAGKIPYLYYGMNTRDARWVTGKEWWYRKTFTVPQDWQGKNLRLRFKAVDYKADVYLNGRHLGQHEGQFTPFAFDIGEAVNFGKENMLVVMIHPVPEPVREVISREGHEWEVMNVMREAYPYWKSMTSSGWDWGADLVSMGIWQDVRLIASNDVYLSNLTVLPEISAPYDQATLNINLNVLADQDKNVKIDYAVRCLTVDQPPVTVTRNGEVIRGDQSLQESVMVEDPLLWWPNGYGDQNLYELSVTLRDAEDNTPLDQLSTTFGIRELEVEENPESPLMDRYMDYNPDYEPGRIVDITDTTEIPRYLIRINGVPVMGMGANWLPPDLLFGRAGQDEYEHLIRLAAEAGMNMFRIWGGGIIDKQVFFDLCDQYGIMLFAEFPNGGVKLPETDEALQITGRETRQILPLMMNHPCVVRYGGGNEWYIGAQNSRQMAQLRQICNEMDPTRPFHDPDPETVAQRHGPHGFIYNTHYQIYNTGYPLTAGPDDPIEWTEYGSSGASSVTTLRRIMPEDHLFPIRPNDPYWM